MKFRQFQLPQFTKHCEFIIKKKSEKTEQCSRVDTDGESCIITYSAGFSIDTRKLYDQVVREANISEQ